VFGVAQTVTAEPQGTVVFPLMEPLSRGEVVVVTVYGPEIGVKLAVNVSVPGKAKL
jgi:hypothetical protein